MYITSRNIFPASRYESLINSVIQPNTVQGHSLTIVGFEKKVDGSRNVIVFDPMFHDSSDVINLVGRELKHKHPADLLKAYRRGSRYLHKYEEFEVLK